MSLLPDIIFVLLEEGQRQVFGSHHEFVSVLELIFNFFDLWFVLCVFRTKFVSQNGIVVAPSFCSFRFKISKFVWSSSSLVGSFSLVISGLLMSFLIRLGLNI